MVNLKKIFLKIGSLGGFKFLNDTQYLKLMYLVTFKKKLNLSNPVTFNEKIQWLKLNDRNKKYIELVDKYKVKEYVSKTIGEEYIIPTLGIWNDFDDINFDKLPNNFVLKCTHDSGGLIICSDKKNFDKKKARKKINKCLKRNYFLSGREWPYKNVKPRIIAEKYMEDKRFNELRDYKFFCFNGSAKFMFVASNRQNENCETCFDFFDMNYNHIKVLNGHPNAKEIPEKPKNFNQMIKLAEKLSSNFPQVRVDFYEVNGKIFFGEMTFYHWSGFVPFYPNKYDKEFGDLINIENIKNKGEKENV